MKEGVSGSIALWLLAIDRLYGDFGRKSNFIDEALTWEIILTAQPMIVVDDRNHGLCVEIVGEGLAVRGKWAIN